MAAVIRLVSIGSETLRAFPLIKGQITIGSAPDNDIVLDHGSVSRRHALIFRRLGRVRVRDLESTNGIRVNGQRVSGSCLLTPGDELEIGAMRFAVMNSPRRRAVVALRAVGATVVVLMLLGFGVTEYLRARGVVFYPTKAALSSSTIAPEARPPAPAAVDGASEAATPGSATADKENRTG